MGDYLVFCTSWPLFGGGDWAEEAAFWHGGAVVQGGFGAVDGRICVYYGILVVFSSASQM